MCIPLKQECIFRRLLNDDFIGRQYDGKALLITACGFPGVLRAEFS